MTIDEIHKTRFPVYLSMAVTENDVWLFLDVSVSVAHPEAEWGEGGPGNMDSTFFVIYFKIFMNL